jgi:hypothetical protein
MQKNSTSAKGAFHSLIMSQSFAASYQLRLLQVRLGRTLRVGLIEPRLWRLGFLFCLTLLGLTTQAILNPAFGRKSRACERHGDPGPLRALRFRSSPLALGILVLFKRPWASRPRLFCVRPLAGKKEVEPRQRAVVRGAGSGLRCARCWAAVSFVGFARVPDGRYVFIPSDTAMTGTHARPGLLGAAEATPN